ncbi:hypothetical protein DV096_11930 [Bradymonadaceae bacterium TMQ3]|uniref:Lipoprotein n=1 Tax=Lujinxingia sediminis TaxID=2480984 RepID=A0ABY0CSE6_9DELT|nr:hypothetical protein [Lujinxingia sediminis]RDV37819.1 hypothetical protein DV096_11930 [Bradymonadaceae bacterium TMQ3]RVU43222.1 hypothetical protein EA187_13515 [Lujinxingia sediminis]TXC75398.1 hypothetical protein FRC91_11825 [Bradymonadales bacterium TMQ1]
MTRWMRGALLSAVVLAAGVGCAMPEYVYVTDYQVVSDRSVKYIYNPLYPSMAGGAISDSALVLEVCSVDAQNPGEETECRETVLLRTEEYQ